MKLSRVPALVLLVLTCVPAAFASCEAAGYQWYPNYDQIANGRPSRDECWNPFNAFYTTQAPSPWGNTNAYEFNYAGSISQTFVVPADHPQTHWELAYTLEFNDPHNDGAWNRFSMEVRDMTTGTALTWYSFNGAGGDQNWEMHRQGFTTGNIAGHTIRVLFRGSKGYSDTYIRVAGVALWQY